MASRRRLLRASATVGTASTAGCLGDVGDILESRHLQAVNVFLENRSRKSRPFHVFLELESGASGWRTTTVAGDASERIAFEPGPDATPNRLHAVVAEHADVGRIIGVDNAEGDYCVTLRVQLDDALDLNQRASYECDAGI